MFSDLGTGIYTTSQEPEEFKHLSTCYGEKRGYGEGTEAPCTDLRLVYIKLFHLH